MKLESSVQEVLQDAVGFPRNEEVDDYPWLALKKCESPIEQMMTIALFDSFHNFNEFFAPLQISLETQSKVELKRFKCRIDIVLTIADTSIYGRGANTQYAIECDGHEFHEKTKEQARKDRSRERKLMELGYKVVRFTGSEIFENPFDCARQVMQIILHNEKHLLVNHGIFSPDNKSR